MPAVSTTHDGAAMASDPTSLAMAGFSSIVMMISAHYAGLIDSLDWVSPLGMVAGISLLLGSVYNFKRGHNLPASNFAIYGAFWLSIAIHMAMEPAADFVQIMTFLRIPIAVYTFYAWVGSLYVSKVSLFVMTTLEVKLVLFIIGQITDHQLIMQIGGCFGIACACGGFYVSASLLVKPKLNLPLGTAVLRPLNLQDSSQAKRGQAHPSKRWTSWPVRQGHADKDMMEAFSQNGCMPKVAP